MQFKKLIQKSLLLLCIAGSFVNTVAASTTPICQPNGYVLGFFNGVFNTRAQAIVGLYALQDNLSTPTYNGAPVIPTLFYNHTGCGGGAISCLEDISEVFQQKAQEIDKTYTISNRFEYFWESMTSVQPNFLDAVSNLATNTALSTLSSVIDPEIRKSIIGGVSYLSNHPPTTTDYASQNAALDAVASKGQMMLLVGHSQGNLFMNHGYDYIKPLTVNNGVAAVHIAPASSSVRGPWVLANIDLVINNLGLFLGSGTVPAVNLNLGPSSSDVSGHTLIGTYLDKSRDGYAAVKTMMTNALASLPAPTECGYSLYGSTLTLTSQNPLGTLVSTTYRGTVTPNGLLSQTAASGYQLVGSTVSIGAKTIEIDYTAYERAAVSSFNGGVFEFTTNTAQISACALDPSSTYTSSQIGVSCTASTVFINESGISTTPSSKILVNLTLSAPSTP